MPRIPLTDEERRIRGRRERHPGRPAGSIRPAAERPRQPSRLGPEGRRAWRHAWEVAHWLTVADVPAVEQLARLADQRAGYAATLASEGLTTAGSRGQLVPHPMVRAIADVDALIGKLHDRLGLTPRGRRALAIATVDPAVDPGDPMDDLLSRGRQRRRS